jgi:tRNA (guanosine-2'-O-)-methyltransferase
VTGISEPLNPAFIAHLANFVSPEKLARFDEALRERTRHLTIVLEDVYQRQNASAVLRNCDCFGIQDVHIIENELPFLVNPDIARGAAQWLTLHHYYEQKSNTAACLQSLRERGYRIVATSPSAESIAPAEFDVTTKTALLFGTEQRGLSKLALEQADAFVTIPMHGLTRSFNLSVAVALCLYELMRKLRQSDVAWQLTADECAELRATWIRFVLKKRLREHEETFLRVIAARVEGA